MRTYNEHRPSCLSAVVLLMLALSAVLGGCGLDFNVSCGEDAIDEVAGLETYTDARYGYTFSYPGDWELREEDATEVSAGAASVGDVSAFDPDGAVDASGAYVDVLQVSVYELAVSVGEGDLDVLKPVLEGLMEDFAGQSTGFETLEPLSETKVGRLSGYKVTCGFTMEGTPVTSTLYFLFDGYMEYQLLLQAADENWEMDRPVFDAFVASFAPGAAE